MSNFSFCVQHANHWTKREKKFQGSVSISQDFDDRCRKINKNWIKLKIKKQKNINHQLKLTYGICAKRANTDDSLHVHILFYGSYFVALISILKNYCNAIVKVCIYWTSIYVVALPKFNDKLTKWQILVQNLVHTQFLSFLINRPDISNKKIYTSYSSSLYY